MYIFEHLKKDFPKSVEKIDSIEKSYSRIFSEKVMKKVFDDSKKETYEHIVRAMERQEDVYQYNKEMSLFERSLNAYPSDFEEH